MGKTAIRRFQILVARIDALADLSRFDEAGKFAILAESSARANGVNGLYYGTFLMSRANVFIAEEKFGQAESDLAAADKIFSTLGTLGEKYKTAAAKVRDRLNRARQNSQAASAISR